MPSFPKSLGKAVTLVTAPTMRRIGAFPRPTKNTFHVEKKSVLPSSNMRAVTAVTGIKETSVGYLAILYIQRLYIEGNKTA